ncbi:18259_t:CDS:10 [Funneliformis geosporum]|uniref:17035_t:CDS:1 n=1 Tax=Funneliformis geosporum TaxID=1117311 RepID=A0A9W4SEL8_9GLOM|nr:17035_t:CDS:10 [Funneliformis geosporum]CAI2168394.1 18259_t:CDS:10 [Funneliformis geosporum]
MQNMVSYEPNKNGSRPYSGNPTKSIQEGVYKGAKQHYDSYAAYRAPPIDKSRVSRSSNKEATARLWDQKQNVTANQRTNSPGGNGFDLESHLDSYHYMHDMDAVYPSHYSHSASHHPYKQFQKPGSNIYNNPAAARPPPQIAVQTVNTYEGRSQSLTSRSPSKSGRRSPQPPHYMTQYSRTISMNGTVSNLIIPLPSYADEKISPRRSTESVRERPKPLLTNQRTERFRSFSYSDASPSSAVPESSSCPSSPSSIAKQYIPIVYPALLSRVAEAFRVRVTLSNRMKDNLEYKDCFDGREAVDKIAFIIKTTDRNLALLLGRAFDSQKFFHDVTYDHRLRDSPNELYQFRKMPSILSSENYELEDIVNEEDAENDLPNGVFTLLTDCYSPTCSQYNLCYSIACPRRLEQHARKNMKPNPGLKRSVSRGSISDKKDQKLWIHSVPAEIAKSVSETEKKRQEAINEVIYTEKDFVGDLEYLRDCWIDPLIKQNVVSESRREKFVEEVFYNILEVHCVNVKLADALEKRQNSFAIVEQIGDIFLEYVPLFDPFIRYGAHQLWGKYEFEKEKNTNRDFAKFVEETERRPESRKLELNGYLTKPTTRLGRYPLLLDAVLKQTPKDHPDRINLPKVINIIKEFLTNVNVESGKSENRFHLQQLNDQLIPKGIEHMDLKLTEEGRQLIFKGSLKKRGGGGESSDLQVFLFDHALLMVKAKTMNKVEQYKIHRKPIPLEFLSVFATEGSYENRVHSRRPQSILPGKTPAVVRGNDRQFALTFCRLGKKAFTITLYAPTYISRKKWIEHIERQREIIKDGGKIFEKEILLEKKTFLGSSKVNCGAFFDNYRKLAFGTDLGIYVLEIGPNAKPAVCVIQLEKISQIDILEEFRLLLILADKSLYSYPLESLDPIKSKEATKRTSKISSHASFFKSGTCLGKTLVTVVKTSALNSIIKTLEPIEQKNKNKSPLKILSGRSNDSLKTYKEFYIPTELTSVNFLNKKLCVGCCAKGFEVVDLETLITQSLIDPEDVSLDFVQKKENVKPIAIYRIAGRDFLLCYDEFAFYVNKVGWRSRPDWLITWEGSPTSFALRYPYVLAFEPSFIEIRHVETGLLEQIIEGHNMRCLYSDSRGNILVVTTDQTTDSSEVFSLKLVDGRKSSLISAATSIATSILAYDDSNSRPVNSS